MQTAARSNLVLTELPSIKKFAGLPATKFEALYQQIIGKLFRHAATDQTIHQIALHLGGLAHHADNLRQLDTVRQTSQMLRALPEPFNHIGEYYRAKYMRHQGDLAEAKLILERVADKAPLRYRARAVQLLGIIAHATGKPQEALPLYLKAARLAASGNWCDPHTTVTATQNIAIFKSSAGDHRAALADLEQLFPLVRAIAEPYKYHHYLNSFAVELGEAGRIEEAQNICKVVLASPYAFAYPEWRETSDEINLRGYKSRSTVSLSRRSTPQNLLHLPERTSSASSTQNPFQQPGSVTKLKDWKKKMVKKESEDDESDLPIEDMTPADMAMKIIELVTADQMEEDRLRKLLEYALEVYSEPEKPA
jgi:tetratricopeptide (TPR) repeat protein